MSRRLRRFALALAAVSALAVWLTMSASAGTRQIPLGGTASPQTGDFAPSSGAVTQDEFPTGEESDEGPDPYDGTISLSNGAGGAALSVLCTGRLTNIIHHAHIPRRS